MGTLFCVNHPQTPASYRFTWENGETKLLCIHCAFQESRKDNCLGVGVDYVREIDGQQPRKRTTFKEVKWPVKGEKDGAEKR